MEIHNQKVKQFLEASKQLVRELQADINTNAYMTEDQNQNQAIILYLKDNLTDMKLSLKQFNIAIKDIGYCLNAIQKSREAEQKEELVEIKTHDLNCNLEQNDYKTHANDYNMENISEFNVSFNPEEQEISENKKGIIVPETPKPNYESASRDIGANNTSGVLYNNTDANIIQDLDFYLNKSKMIDNRVKKSLQSKFITNKTIQTKVEIFSKCVPKKQFKNEYSITSKDKNNLKIRIKEIKKKNQKQKQENVLPEKEINNTNNNSLCIRNVDPVLQPCEKEIINTEVDRMSNDDLKEETCPQNIKKSLECKNIQIIEYCNDEVTKDELSNYSRSKQDSDYQACDFNKSSKIFEIRQKNKGPRFPAVEDYISKWVMRKYGKKGDKISSYYLKLKALKYSRNKRFRASDSWLKGFLKRNPQIVQFID